MKIIIKLSGELVKHPELVNIFESLREKYMIAVVVGGGNVVRGRDYNSLDIDAAGIFSTVVNAFILKSKLKRSIVMSSVSIDNVPRYSREQALKELEKGNIVILAAGLGIPLFSTDSAAAVRAIELDAEKILKVTKVDGVYDKDPMKFSDAKKFDTLLYSDLIDQRLEVIDLTASVLLSEAKSKISTHIFNGMALEEWEMALEGKKGTVVE